MLKLNEKAVVETASKQFLRPITHLCIAAHPDDIEFMAYSGILQCYKQADKGFCGVCVTNGANSPRTGKYASFTPEQMTSQRAKEQFTAAKIGDYTAQVMLNYTSDEVKQGGANLLSDIEEIILTVKPTVIYTHNVADAHPTHVAVALAVIEVLKKISAQYIPKYFLGSEVWRSLDWLPDEYKIQEPTCGNSVLEKKILCCYKTQIAGGKNYAQAVLGRRNANATFSKSHSVDEVSSLANYIDYMPLLATPKLTVEDFIKQRLLCFVDSVLTIASKP